MNLREMNIVVNNIANIVGGTVLMREFLQTDKMLYLFLHEVDDLEALNTMLNNNGLKAIVVSKREKKYEIDDMLEFETDVFEFLGQDCLMIQGSYLFEVFNNKIKNMRLISKNVL